MRLTRPTLSPSHPLAIAGVYALISLLLTWPLILHFGDAVPAGGDAWENIWNLWWLRKAIETGQWPFHTDYKYFPYGVNLYFDTIVPLAGLLGAPLQWLGLSLVSTYNVLVLLSFVLSALGMYLLARYLTADTVASFIAGFIFGFCPYHFAHLYGHLNLMWMQWMPFYILFLLKAVEGALGQGEQRFAPTEADATPSPAIGEGWGAEQPAPTQSPALSTQHSALSTLRNALLAGLFLVLNAYSEWTYAIFLGLFTIFYLLYRLWGLRREGRRMVRLIAPLAAMGGLFLLLTAPVLIGTIIEIRTVQYTQLPLTEQLYYSADLYAYITPSTLHPIFGPAVTAIGQRFDAPPGDLVITPGITPLLLGIFALVVWKRRAVRFWGWSALLFIIVSLGPILHIANNTQFTDFNGSMVMPYALLYELPFFSVMRTPMRFAVLVVLALAALAAYAVKYIRARPGGYVTAWLIPAVLLGLIAFEYITVPVPMSPPPQPLTFYHRIHDEGGNFAIAELPMRPMVDYLTYQTISDKPIVGGHLARQPIDKFAQEQPALRYFADGYPAAQDGAVLNGVGAAALAKAGVRYVAVHWWALTEAQKADMHQKLYAVFGNQQPADYAQDQMSVYRTAP